ncbi:MAG TPA: hypothetical protein PKB03_00435 [Baekduia sp.]|nr:hypothetical protein [Baekduia sp.]
MEQPGGEFVPPVPTAPVTGAASAPTGVAGPETGQGLQWRANGVVLPVVRSVGFCALMLIGSFGLWSFAWVWHTAQEVSPRIKRAIGEGTWSPEARTALVWVPIVGLIVVYQSWRDISHFATQAGTKSFSPGGYLAGYVVVSLLPFFGIFGVAFPWVVQEKMNDAWRAAEPERAAKAPMMQADWIPLGIGLAIWGLFVISFLASF